MKESITFMLPVFKDQTVVGNEGKKVVIDDVVDFVISNGALSPETVQPITVTKVGDSGKTIEYDRALTGNLSEFYVVRVHAKHNYNCPAPADWSVSLTELDPATVAMAVSSITLNGVVRPIGVTEAAVGGGITTAFADAVVGAINNIIGEEGHATYSITGAAGTQVLSIVIHSLTVNFGAIATAGATVAGPVKI